MEIRQRGPGQDGKLNAYELMDELESEATVGADDEISEGHDGGMSERGVK